MSYSRRSPRLCEALTPTVMRHTGVEKSAEAIVVATRRRRAESAVRSRTWIAQTTGKKSEAGNRENLATKGGEVECRDMGARCQSGCDEKRTREHAERTALNCGNREVPATGMLRGVGGEAFLPYPIRCGRSLRTSGDTCALRWRRPPCGWRRRSSGELLRHARLRFPD